MKINLWTTHPEIASMLFDGNIGYKKSHGSHYITDWICPDCGSLVKDKSIHDVVNHGLPCSNCSSGISYPEKVLMSFLNQLDVNYIYNKSTEWSDRKRYDFYICDKKLIIECHGLQHYFDVNYNSFKNLEFQIKNDTEKENIAISNGIKYYIQLDCKKSDFKYIKESILNSELKNLFDLSDFDWDTCNKNICLIKSNCYNDVFNLVLDGIDSPKEISNILNISESTALRYLKKLSDEGVSNYNAKTSTLNRVNKIKEKYSKSVICVETGVIYSSIAEASRDVGCFAAAISECCRKLHRTCRGYHWMFYKDYLLTNKE